MIDFSLSEEQNLLVEMTRSFVEKEMIPHEEELERSNHLHQNWPNRLKQSRWSWGFMTVIFLPRSVEEDWMQFP